MNCPKCGAQLFEGAVFCGTCGYRLQVAPPVSSGPPAGSGHGIHIDENSQGQGRGYKYEVLLKPFFPSQSGSGGGFNINLGG